MYENNLTINIFVAQESADLLCMQLYEHLTINIIVKEEMTTIGQLISVRGIQFRKKATEVTLFVYIRFNAERSTACYFGAFHKQL